MPWRAPRPSQRRNVLPRFLPTVPGEEDDRSLGHTNHGSSGRGKAGFCPHTTKLSLARPPTVHGEEDDRSLGDTNHGSSGRGEAVFVCGRKTKGTEGKEKNGREEKEEGCERHTPYLWQRVRGPFLSSLRQSFHGWPVLAQGFHLSLKRPAFVNTGVLRSSPNASAPRSRFMNPPTDGKPSPRF